MSVCLEAVGGKGGGNVSKAQGQSSQVNLVQKAVEKAKEYLKEHDM